MRVCKHGCDVTLSVFPQHNLKPLKDRYKYQGIQMKKSFPSFDLGIDHLFPSDPEERKQKKEEQQRFAYLDVSKLDDLVEGAQAKTTKYATKYAENAENAKRQFLHLFTTIKFSKSHSVFPKKCTIKLNANYMLQTVKASNQILHGRSVAPS